MLEAKEVVKSFDGFRALDSATLTVPKGTVYGLVGPNGAGKSTIIRHFTGVYRPDSGQLLLEGAPIWENTDAKRRMVVIPDDWYYFPQASIAEMAKLYAGAYPSFSWERYEKMKQVFPLNDRQMLRRMSKGMQKQAAFWLTMCCMPEYLILDEPVDGLDPVMRRQVWSLLLGDVAERGTTVLVSSHNLRELEDFCDHVGLIHKGGVVFEQELDELKLGIHKVQAVYRPALDSEALEELRDTLDIIKLEIQGSMVRFVARGSQEEIDRVMQHRNTIFYETLPLSLEEVFISEMEAAGYDLDRILS